MSAMSRRLMSSPGGIEDEVVAGGFEGSGMWFGGMVCPLAAVAKVSNVAIAIAIPIVISRNCAKEERACIFVLIALSTKNLLG